MYEWHSWNISLGKCKEIIRNSTVSFVTSRAIVQPASWGQWWILSIEKICYTAKKKTSGTCFWSIPPLARNSLDRCSNLAEVVQKSSWTKTTSHLIWDNSEKKCRSLTFYRKPSHINSSKFQDPIMRLYVWILIHDGFIHWGKAIWYT